MIGLVVVVVGEVDVTVGGGVDVGITDDHAAIGLVGLHAARRTDVVGQLSQESLVVVVVAAAMDAVAIVAGHQERGLGYVRIQQEVGDWWNESGE